MLVAARMTRMRLPTFSAYPLMQFVRESRFVLACLQIVDVDVEAASIAVLDRFHELIVSFAS